MCTALSLFRRNARAILVKYVRTAHFEFSTGLPSFHPTSRRTHRCSVEAVPVVLTMSSSSKTSAYTQTARERVGRRVPRRVLRNFQAPTCADVQFPMYRSSALVAGPVTQGASMRHFRTVNKYS